MRTPYQLSQIHDVGRRDVRLGQPALLYQQPQMPRVGAVGLGAPLATPQGGGVGRFGQMRNQPRPREPLATNRQPAHASTANAASPAGSVASHDANISRVAGDTRPRAVSPVAWSTQSYVIWFRCTSKPPTMLIGTSFELRPIEGLRMPTSLSRRGSQHMSSFATRILELLVTIPGVGRRVAEVIIAEIGVDMSVFASDAHLASWAAVCPGNNSSAGKHYSGATRKGNVWLLDALTQAAWAAGRVKDDYLSAQFWRLARRIGKTKAVVAVAYFLLVAAYHVIATGQPYHDLDADCFTTRADPERRARHTARQLGYHVTLTMAA